ncbi:VPS35 endosomal protein-sorting factor-like isoform X2 [Telopea speciosissima]|uniref:VPS35 endosomal protein-sorting factor-like isoform X2 n=1 Tax=Telopea speciosissima TaxID=54955 RepID=UPI001CC77215|nr:VPS35 endosomal protein-sorting factor-like isoform X2 [Telopea speciosissima]
MEFKTRDYGAEEASHSLPRMRTDSHPLAVQSSLELVAVAFHEKIDLYDPLRALDADFGVSAAEGNDVEYGSTRGSSNEAAIQRSAKEWASFKRSLMQRFAVAKTISISSMSDVIVKSGKEYEKPPTRMHLEELDDPQKEAEADVKIITRQEYVSRLHELKDEISHAWRAEDRVTALKLSIKVARLLMDTSVLQFYPTVFVLVTDVLDILGDMVWERIKRKAEYADDGTMICSLPDDFEASDVCSDAKETCNNWFCKIGSIRELLPRIYLELAIFCCWRFLHDRPWENLKRLVMMMRGLADPLASAYCHLYLARCAQKLPPHNIGYLVTCINDIKVRIILGRESMNGNSSEDRKMSVSLFEPAIGWIIKCLLKDTDQMRLGDVLVELGLRPNVANPSVDFPCISVVLHHLLEELPAEVISSNALEIMQLIERSEDYSFDKYLNYMLLGFKLCERIPLMDAVDAILVKVFQVVAQYDGLDEYLKVVDAYLDIILHYQIGNYLTIILDGISDRACNKGVAESELGTLQSIFIKLLSHFDDLNDVLALNHFVEILDVMYGSTRNIVNTHILNKATRNGYIRDPTTVQLLFEISQALHDDIDFSSIKDDDNQHPVHLISRFVRMVDFGAEMENHLIFLVECRGAFGSTNELKETLVHSSNYLAVKAMKDAKKHISFLKSCIAFSEVTIPSISIIIRQMNLYLETAEVALLGGLVSHTDGLIDSTISCLQSLEVTNGRTPVDLDGILSSVRKLCSLLILIPANPECGATYIPRNVLSKISSQSWITPRLRIRTFCAVVCLSTTLSQHKLPYHANSREVVGNDLLFFSEPSYYQELLSFSGSVVQNLVDEVKQEPNQAARGSLALEACNCIISSFIANQEIVPICSKLIEIAKSCLNANNKYLHSTVNYLDKHFSTSTRGVPAVTT